MLTSPPLNGSRSLGGSDRKEADMPRLRHTVEQIFSKLREAEVALSKGQPLGHVCRTLAIAEHTYAMNCRIANCLRHYGESKYSWNDGAKRIIGFGHIAP